MISMMHGSLPSGSEPRGAKSGGQEQPIKGSGVDDKGTVAKNKEAILYAYRRLAAGSSIVNSKVSSRLMLSGLRGQVNDEVLLGQASMRHGVGEGPPGQYRSFVVFTPAFNDVADIGSLGPSLVAPGWRGAAEQPAVSETFRHPTAPSPWGADLALAALGFGTETSAAESASPWGAALAASALGSEHQQQASPANPTITELLFPRGLPPPSNAAEDWRRVADALRNSSVIAVSGAAVSDASDSSTAANGGLSSLKKDTEGQVARPLTGQLSALDPRPGVKFELDWMRWVRLHGGWKQGIVLYATSLAHAFLSSLTLRLCRATPLQGHCGVP